MAPSNVAFTLFGWPFYWYGIIIALSALLGILISMKGAPKYGVKADDIIDAALLAIPLAVIGGRLYYVAFSLPYYLEDLRRVIAFREGGMAIYGSIIGGAIGLLIAGKWKKIKYITLFDIITPALVLGQAIGRWGNFFNQEAYGAAITNPALQWFPIAVYIENMAYSAEGPYHMATFFYESMACFAIFAFLMNYRRKERQPGNVFLWYLVLYGVARAIIEQFRTDSLWLGPVRISQIVSLLMVLVGAALLFMRARSEKKVSPETGLDPGLRILREHAERSERAEELLTGLGQDGLVIEELVVEDEDADVVVEEVVIEELRPDGGANDDSQANAGKETE